ncbi:flagellar biosynthesis protein FlhA [Candidatus Kryptonium thompsonii]|uniref:Flagellar biosynthesis protein FlhA n=1 Tax=Candidatus Kryptonium thompsonii TaxID=1633631 RepID=A0A0P1LRZ2_9BACT|nr:flagellar biosynthesis protein FlhA [Candidatus Kryptonium thompsoni]CUS77543.1 flagellar biosynthesis protein FlhA [Candidatus Kryptonium thompsoni]CUS79717.1 flagellar biosynthesis protein FlhA [Candidatus Kryptonium thompsoni]CUS80972.1 flagellar biosynthesis protein FlhA [Candidatus Kryptonium thompsoni]CUS84566.1 flagellar biosynthesis protein FlhA [Candidatus Kryptonium thompsoni]CUT07197.1 flagellar biosynthesis protein FlhA [Candidatus Kryptonium thompsoni]
MNENGFLQSLSRNSDVILAVAVISILVFMILPLPPFLLDILIAFNITFSVIILLISMYITSPLELSVFPGLLLIITLFRLSLNVASTRLILGDGYAGKIIFAFGSFVVKGNYVVGFIVFLILVVIQFVVITKGASRIAEVAARFTLDAMPGKQMSIDADLNAGLITEEEARRRRALIQREAEFYGAMDGASKFVRGDAIAGLIITVINIVGGLIIGVLQRGMTFTEALQNYVLLTIGDGLVSQIPALIISISAGMVVTRNASGNQFDVEVKGQIFQRPKALLIASGVLAFFAIVPGLPMLPFLILSVISGVAGYFGTKFEKEKAVVPEVKPKAVAQPEEKIEKLVQIDPIEIEIGYGLIPLADEEQGGTLFKRIIGVRKQLALELGIIVPPIRVRDNIYLEPSEYVIKIRGNKVAGGEVKPGYYLAMNPGTAEEEIHDAIKVKDPVYGFDAYWIPAHKKEEAEIMGYTVVEPVSVIVTHLVEVLRKNAGKILSRQDTKTLIDSLREEYPALVEEITPDVLPIGTIQKVLQNLLNEGIPIRDMVTILEALLDYSRVTKNVDVLTEYVRHSLSETIARLYRTENNVIPAIQLDPRIEDLITQSLQQSSSQSSPTLGLPPDIIRVLNLSLAENVKKAKDLGYRPVVICSATVRLYFYRLIHSTFPDVSVISYTELPTDVDIEIIGRIKINNHTSS